METVQQMEGRLEKIQFFQEKDLQEQLWQRKIHEMREGQVTYKQIKNFLLEGYGLVREVGSQNRLKREILLLEEKNKKVEKYLGNLRQEKDKSALANEFMGVNLVDEITEYKTQLQHNRL